MVTTDTLLLLAYTVPSVFPPKKFTKNALLSAGSLGVAHSETAALRARNVARRILSSFRVDDEDDPFLVALVDNIQLLFRAR